MELPEGTIEPAVIEAPEPEAPEAPKEEPKEQTVGEILNDKPKENLIPEPVFLNEKKGRKDAEKRVKELEAQIASGATREEVSDDIDALLDQYGLDDTNKQFFNKLAKGLETRAERRAEEKLSAKLAPIEARDKSEKIDSAFKKHYGDAIEQFPELKDVANPEVVKAWSLDPRNADKTFTQLIEEIYGGVPQGKRTIESATPRGGKDPEAVDFDRAKKDSEYLNEILSNPQTKTEYNKGLQERISRFL